MDKNEDYFKSKLKEEMKEDKELYYMIKLIEAINNDDEELIDFFQKKLRDYKEPSKSK